MRGIVDCIWLSYIEEGFILVNTDRLIGQFGEDAVTATLDSLVSQGKLRMKTTVRCEEGHDIWVGSEAEEPKYRYYPCEMSGCEADGRENYTTHSYYVSDTWTRHLGETNDR